MRLQCKNSMTLRSRAVPAGGAAAAGAAARKPAHIPLHGVFVLRLRIPDHWSLPILRHRRSASHRSWSVVHSGRIEIVVPRLLRLSKLPSEPPHGVPSFVLASLLLRSL